MTAISRSASSDSVPEVIPTFVDALISSIADKWRSSASSMLTLGHVEIEGSRIRLDRIEHSRRSPLCRRWSRSEDPRSAIPTVR